MARTYNLTNLAIEPGTSTAADRPKFGLAMARFLLEDKPDDAGNYPAGSLTDEEINAWLEGTKITDATSSGGDGTDYYFPHRAAAAIIRARPSWATQFSFTGYSQTNRGAGEIAAAIIAANRWIDDDIRDATDDRVGGLSLEATL